MKKDIDFDNAWKQLITKHFKDFVDFFYPKVSQDINWDKGFTFLDKELEKLFPKNKFTKRYADKLAEVCLNNGVKKWVLVHLEIQNSKDNSIAKRMFTYYYKILDKYDKDIISLLLLTDTNKSWKPSIYKIETS